MSQNDKTSEIVAPEPAPAPEEKGSIADAVFDIGLEWASYGLTAGRNALKVSASTLERTAALLERVRDELKAKDEAPPSAPKAA